MPKGFRVLEAARAVIDEVGRLMAKSRPPLSYDRQLSDAAQSIAANIREAQGRETRGERRQYTRYARGSVEETDEHLRKHFAAKRIHAKVYWPLHNRLAVIHKMLTKMMLNQ